ncbi:DUF885 domain-containing protein [Pseudomaricurvus alkylphenolicus]|uniref:DUF885 domain-containing protein n=1 Tax=Pseudomaricurvus alkylphenolicus TaxID=1306991 RepID=UPI00141DE7E3|nr:DUF885 domain-containing protein [Pseudomaricurvus alkylphenolicus]NIB44972.1 DUF885 domain-containing protein [Pseudomaricurvus alkylphenolicus]
MKTTKVLLLSAAVALAACSETEKANQKTSAVEKSAAEQVAAPAVADKQSAGASLEALTQEFLAASAAANPYVLMLAGKQVTQLPELSIAASEKQAQGARDYLARLAEIDRTALNHEDQLTADIFEQQMQLLVADPKHYWHQFSVTPYQSGFVVSTLLPGALAGASLNSQSDVETYLALIADIGRFTGDQLTKLKGQDERGILLPKPAIPGARSVYQSLKTNLPALTAVADARVATLTAEQKSALFSGRDAILAKQVNPAIDALLEYLSDDYLARAPESVGLGQYPGGKEAYAHAIKRETTLDLSPEEIHQLGLDSLTKIQKEMQAIRDELGFKGSAQEFHDQMRKDPRFFAKTPEEVKARYDGYITKIEPHIDDYFSLMPKAPYGSKRLDPAAEAGMTFGYYQMPNKLESTGLYRFNGSNLSERPMVWTAPLIFHELIPGHHFHLALQSENENLSAYRKSGSMVTAFNEGWANYAASLALEMGFLDSMDRYGYLLFDSFISNRLVVDTGMNYFGWSAEKALEFTLANTFSTKTESSTEMMRYSTDMPAQALAYKLGFEFIKGLRSDMEAKYGDKFEIKKFHAAVVGSGALPMPVLEKHVAWSMGQ